MLDKASLTKLRELVTTAQNPYAFYDDDPDGFVSYLLIKKAHEPFDGTIIKGSPMLEPIYATKVNKNIIDRVFILDKPLVDTSFVRDVKLPIVWVDHHEPQNIGGVTYFNPRVQAPKDRSPTSYIIYKAVGGPLWLAMVGVVGDWYLCPELKLLQKKKPKLLSTIKSPPHVLFETQFGTVIKTFAFLLKQPVRTINKFVPELLTIKEPEEILEQKTPAGKMLMKNYLNINKEYEPLLQEALTKETKNSLVYTYTALKRSFTGELSNELLHRAKAELIVVARLKDGEYKMSLRTRKVNLQPIIKKALVGIQGHGGGHEQACGACVPEHAFEGFIEKIKREMV
ncbi:hypothetical protein CL622_08645 [archaeon]|nr:hypothetical protein [archaeon]|tara:strand:- start:16 stop:1038 length:1023 start_codon:yes stop_codon:yes gene_type:complete